MLEGGPSKTYQKTRQMLVTRPDLWDALMEKLTAMSIVYLGAQIEAGAAAIQIFDSWVGAVSAREYEARIYPFMKELITALKTKFPTTPITMFGVGTYHLLPLWRQLPVDVIGLDWRSPIADAKAMGDYAGGAGQFGSGLFICGLAGDSGRNRSHLGGR